MRAERSCDLVVAGATLGGCLTALAAARQGLRVALVEASPFLGTDITAVLRPWLRASVPVGGTQPAMDLRDVLCPAAEAAEVDVDLTGLPAPWRESAPETALFRGSVRKRLLEALDAAEVTTLLMCSPAGVLSAGEGRVTGLLLATKQGLLRLDGHVVVDATASADVLRLYSPALVTDPPRPVCRFTLGFAGAGWPATRELAVDPALGLAGHRVVFHAGRNSACPLFAEFAFEVAPGGGDRRSTRARTEFEARERAIALTRELVRTEPALARAVLAEVAATAWEPSPSCLANDRLPPGLMRGPAGLGAEASWADLAALQADAGQVAAACGRPGGGPVPTTVRSGAARLEMAACRCEPLDDPRLGIPLQCVQLTSLDAVPAAAPVDVLVAGGGTAGANAAVAALEAGAETAVLEQLSDLGGTQTLGLVSGYYHGYRGGFTARLDEQVAALADAMHPGRAGNRRLVKMLHYLQAVASRGGRWYPGAVVCGGAVDAGRVHGVLAADRDGLFRLQAKVTLDATGDGDVAAFCGVRTSFGDPRSGTAQDCSQWSLGRGGWETLAADLDVIDQRLLSETLRGLRLAHRRGRWFDFAPMLTVREGRHIDGEYTLDLRDILAGRPFDDAIAVACTDWDPHGPSTSWLGRLGFLPLQTAQIPMRIPLRCCVPRGLTGLLVTAKAISATPDAACLCRMAPDVQNLGYATGLAAAATAKAAGDPRRVDLPALSARLRELGIVTDSLPTPWPAAADLDTTVQRLAAGDEMALRDVALADATAALPRLEAAFAPAGTDRTNVAKGLAWFGSPLGNDLLVTALSRLAPAEVLPYDDSHPHKPGKPRAGMVDGPDDFWRLNQLLVLLGLARVRDAAGAVAAVIERADAGGPPVRAINAYIRDRIDMQRVPHFDRLLSLAFCAERLGEPRLAPALDRLLDREFIGGYAGTEATDSGRRYQGALAEVLLAAAAARCGSRHGALRLTAFLDDTHAILARFAASELRAISGQDCGSDRGRWERWLHGAGSLEPRPLPAGPPVF